MTRHDSVFWEIHGSWPPIACDIFVKNWHKIFQSKLIAYLRAFFLCKRTHKIRDNQNVFCDFIPTLSLYKTNEQKKNKEELLVLKIANNIHTLQMYVYMYIYACIHQKRRKKKKEQKHRYNKWINKQGCIVRSFVYWSPGNRENDDPR